MGWLAVEDAAARLRSHKRQITQAIAVTEAIQVTEAMRPSLAAQTAQFVLLLFARGLA